MRSLFYLSSCTLKNKLLELVKKPGKLILSLIFIVLLVMNLSLESISASGTRPINEFYTIIFIFYILSFISETNKGFSHGGTMFSLSDVSFLFMSPVKPAAVLLYGMLSRLGTSLWMGLAFVYQFSLLRSFYPVGIKEMLVSVIGYAAVTFVSQLAGMLVYFFTCGDEKKVAAGKKIFYTVILAFAVMLASGIDFGTFSLSAAAEGLTKDYMLLFPVAGWTLLFVRGVIQGRIAFILAGALACVAFSVITFVILSRSEHGYYEDVLVTAEKNSALSQEEKQAGRRKKVKKVNGALTKGKGASVFLYKHILENRRSGTALLSPMSLFYVILIGIYGFVFKGDALTLFILSCMLSIHTVLSGRWLREISMPYIFMVPGAATKKLFFILPELLPKVIAESVLQCAVIAFVCRTGAVLTVAFIAARISFCFLLTATALLVSKLMREREKSNVFVMLCLFFGMMFSVPSLILAAGLAFFGMGLIIAISGVSIINIAVGFAVLFMSRKLLSSAD